MGRAPCCDKAKVKKGPWSPDEDAKLKSHIQNYGTGGNWITLPNKIGLKRCGKSCRLRWLNYLRPNLKHGGFTADEDNLICTLYLTIGSRWSVIAAQLPGRTDNDIKNYWNTRLKKKLLANSKQRIPIPKIGPAPPPPPQPPGPLPDQCRLNNLELADNFHHHNLRDMIDLPSQLHTSSSMQNFMSWEHMNSNYQPWIVFDEPTLLAYSQ